MPKSYWDLYQDSDFTPAAFPYPMTNATAYTFNNIHELRGSYYLETNTEGEALPLDVGILPEDQQRTLLHGYYACVSFVDVQVGRLLDELDALGLSSNTIVVLWGDHGWFLGEHNEWGKHSHLEMAARAPLIVRAPSFATGKTTSPTEFLDLYPTLCDLAGLPLPTQPWDENTPTGRPLRGKSLRPILQNPETSIRYGAITHYGSGTYGYAYRTRRYRYVEWIGQDAILARELYDYEKDPLETINLAPLPEYEALMYQFSRSMRETGECEGCERLKSVSPVAAPTERDLAGLHLRPSTNDLQLSWPGAAAAHYRVLHTATLTNQTWQTHSTGLTTNRLDLTPNLPATFYRVEVEN
jgi:arylsulfatase A-like enzyme